MIVQDMKLIAGLQVTGKGEKGSEFHALIEKGGGEDSNSDVEIHVRLYGGFRINCIDCSLEPSGTMFEGNTDHFYNHLAQHMEAGHHIPRTTLLDLEWLAYAAELMPEGYMATGRGLYEK